MKFLKEIAGSFYGREGQKINEICFVFPGRRAALFFQKELGEITEKPIFSPIKNGKFEIEKGSSTVCEHRRETARFWIMVL